MPKFLDSTGLLTLLQKIKNTFVTKTSDDVITGTKTFKNTLPNNAHTSGIVIRNPDITRGTAPSTAKYDIVSFCDSSGAEWNSNGTHGRIGAVRAIVDNTNNVTLHLSLWKYAANSTDSTTFAIKYPASSNPYTFGPNCYPDKDNQFTLGTTSYRWKQLYAGTTTISTSDERIKQNIVDISNEVLDAWEDVHWSQFLFKDAAEEKKESARIHTGLIAQRILKAFNDHQLNAAKYGLLCHDSWNASPEERDENGNIVKEAIPAGDLYSLRYEECLAIEAAYQRRRADRLEARIAALEEKLK